MANNSKPVASPTAKPTPPAPLSPTAVPRIVAGDSLASEVSLATNAGLLYFGGFEGHPWQQSMQAIISGGNEHYAILPATGYGGSLAMRTYFAAGSYGDPSAPAGMSATIFRVPFVNSGTNIGSRTDLYLRYLVRFMPGFNFAKSGKLPGLAGGTSNTGGQVPTGYDGWSGRLDWTSGGGIISYLYVPGITDYGIELPWRVGSQSKLLVSGKWQCLELRYVMNTPGQANGIAQGWINNQLALDQRTINFRTTPKLAIDNVMFSTFFGGGTADFASPINQYTDFDNFALGTQYINCPG